jgi:two-component system, sensor histidine kinase and response regulator
MPPHVGPLVETPSLQTSKKILVVDDDPGMADSVCRYLNREGLQASSMSDPLGALQELESSDYGVLVTDILMPGMDGVGLLRAAKKVNPFLQVILMTGQVRMSYLLEGFAAGASNCFFKPFESMTPLTDEVRGCLAKIERIREVLLHRSQL